LRSAISCIEVRRLVSALGRHERGAMLCPTGKIVVGRVVCRGRQRHRLVHGGPVAANGPTRAITDCSRRNRQAFHNFCDAFAPEGWIVADLWWQQARVENAGPLFGDLDPVPAPNGRFLLQNQRAQRRLALFQSCHFSTDFREFVSGRKFVRGTLLSFRYPHDNW
jgi:hypothetical protein